MSFHLLQSAMVALSLIVSTLAQTPAPAAAVTPAGGLFSGFTFPNFNIPTFAPIGIPCAGVSSLQSGTCRKDAGECSSAGGVLDGNCVAGFGQCCVQPLKCGGQSLTNGSFLGNSKYPSPDTASNECTITIDKTQLDIKQIRLELIKFDVGTPDAEGKCSNDFMSIQSGLAPGASIPRLCGKNNGQHIILPVSQNLKDQTVVIRFSISGSSKSTWLIQAIQLKAQDALIAPDNCLQFNHGPSGHIASLSEGANLDKLRYAICFRKEEGYCSIKFTLNSTETADNSTVSDNSTSTESRRRREASGYYAAGNYLQPQRQAQSVRPAPYLAPQAPVQQQRYQYKQPAPYHYHYPAYPASPFRPPYDTPYHSTEMPATSSTGMSILTTTAGNGTEPTEPSVTTSPSVPSPTCDGQDIVLFPPSTIICASNLPTAPIIVDSQWLIVFVDNRGTPPHATGWKYSYQYDSCRN